MTTSIIDHFNDIFAHHIDSGFGLLGPEIDCLAIGLIAASITMAGLLWRRDAKRGRDTALSSKALAVGALVVLLWNPGILARILVSSYASLGLPATLPAERSMQPSELVQTGIDAGRSLLVAAEQFQLASLSEHFVEIVVVLIAASTVLAVFFILALRLLIALVVFKLTALAGFALVPFGICGRAGDLTKRLLGEVVVTAVRVLVLTAIVGLGTALFGQIVHEQLPWPSPDDALVQMLAALALLGLAMFGTDRVCRLIADISRQRIIDVGLLLQHRRNLSATLTAPARTTEIAVRESVRNAPEFGKRRARVNL